MNDPDVFSNPCGVCNKRTATRLCDYITEYGTSIFFKSYKRFTEQQIHDTCDLPMCEECSYRYNRGRDFCPHHKKMLELSRTLPDNKQEVRRQKEKVRIFSESEEIRLAKE